MFARYLVSPILESGRAPAVLHSNRVALSLSCYARGINASRCTFGAADQTEPINATTRLTLLMPMARYPRKVCRCGIAELWLLVHQGREVRRLRTAAW